MQFKKANLHVQFKKIRASAFKKEYTKMSPLIGRVGVIS